MADGTIYGVSTDKNYIYNVKGVGGGGGAVDSVNGKTGNVVLDASDIGLANVDNTSDADKPISTAQAVVNALKLNIADVVDNVATTTTNQALSANQGKLLNDAIVALQGSLIPQGAWDADTNDPTLPGTATKGEYYIVSVEGNTALDGITDWKVNDWAVKTATGWAKIDNTDAVLTVAGRTGNVVIAISDIAGLQTALDAKSNVADIVDVLTSTSAVVPLSANMGRELKAEIDGITEVDEGTATGQLVVWNDTTEKYEAQTHSQLNYDAANRTLHVERTEGRQCDADGDYSHAEGVNTEAMGQASHSEGTNTLADATNSHAEGNGTTASGTNAHAEGNDTVASGLSSHAEGDGTTASGDYSHAEGDGTTASGRRSHAEGHDTVASGRNSHAEGDTTEAHDFDSHAQGRCNIVSTGSDHSWVDADELYVIGNGADDANRSNAMRMLKNGNTVWSGEQAYSDTGIEGTTALDFVSKGTLDTAIANVGGSVLEAVCTDATELQTAMHALENGNYSSGRIIIVDHIEWGDQTAYPVITKPLALYGESVTRAAKITFGNGDYIQSVATAENSQALFTFTNLKFATSIGTESQVLRLTYSGGDYPSGKIGFYNCHFTGTIGRALLVQHNGSVFLEMIGCKDDGRTSAQQLIYHNINTTIAGKGLSTNIVNCNFQSPFFHYSAGSAGSYCKVAIANSAITANTNNWYRSGTNANGYFEVQYANDSTINWSKQGANDLPVQVDTTGGAVSADRVSVDTTGFTNLPNTTTDIQQFAEDVDANIGAGGGNVDDGATTGQIVIWNETNGKYEPQTHADFNYDVADKTLHVERIEGSGCNASGSRSHAEGLNTTASGSRSHAEGEITTASGAFSHAEGYHTAAGGYASHAEGRGTIASSFQTHAEGYETTASGNCSHAEGDGTTASGNRSHAEGLGTEAHDYTSHAQGRFNIVSTGNQTSWVDTDELFVIGNGTDDANRANAVRMLKNGNTVWSGQQAYSDTGIEGSSALDFVSKGTLDTAIVGATSTAITTKTANYVLTASDDVILIDASSNSVEIALPSATAIKQYIIKAIDVTNTAKIIPSGVEEIDGSSDPLHINNQYDAVTVVSDGSNWWVI